MNNFFQNKKILITGACGTVGRVLVRELLQEHFQCEIIGLDNNESQLFLMKERYANYPNAQFFLADVRDRDRISRQMANIDIVFHTAAYKHVSLCEQSPIDAIQTNILGVQNLISAGFENKVKKVIFTSSDKAVNPTSVMGTSKLMGERLMTAANCNGNGDTPIFASTRFGNVLGSSGSVIPIFKEQIRSGGPVTLTHTGMTRFIMSIDEAVRLVMESCGLAMGGEVFITKMPVIRISDLAKIMIRELAPSFGFSPQDIEIQIIGVKPGEKMYEELMNQEETRRTWELKNYFVVFPAFRGMYQKIEYSYPDIISKSVTNPYISEKENPLSENELAAFLKTNALI
ncbi:MAG: SDR family NAD(P)-dependent oxidoreductase [Desulfobacteraceae bacterium]|jgi:FlaA1/EpsC-like NDP-sugar epimerase|nr:SDR family NAD(P)-dependent oxidoreductase [Desulfobacteraceae bacterium]